MASFMFIGYAGTQLTLENMSYVYYGAPYVSIPGGPDTDLLDMSNAYFGAPLASYARGNGI